MTDVVAILTREMLQFAREISKPCTGHTDSRRAGEVPTKEGSTLFLLVRTVASDSFYCKPNTNLAPKPTFLLVGVARAARQQSSRPERSPPGLAVARDCSRVVLPSRWPTMNKPEKESRPERVGLVYRCKVCGAPKKGHVCKGPGTWDGGDGAVAGTGATKRKATSSAQSEDKGDNWYAPAIVSDIMSVSGSGMSSSKAAGKKKPEKSQSKRTKRDEEDGEKEMLEASRPSSLITPDDVDSSARGFPARPHSLRSSSSSFMTLHSSASPGFMPFMSAGTPAPGLPTPEIGLSPGTLNVLGGQVHRELRSTRRRQQELKRLASLP